MTSQRSTSPGIQTGLIILGLTTLGFVFLFWRSEPQALTPQPPDTLSLEEIGAAFEDEMTGPYLRRFETRAPDLSEQLRDALTAAVEDGASKETLRAAVLTASLSAIQQDGAYLRYARVSDFDALVNQFESGLMGLKAAQSDWCKGPRIEAFLKVREADLVPELIRTLSASPEAYRWALAWSNELLQVSASAKALPVRHGPRTPRDKALLQQTGLSLGAEYWTLGLQIAAFSKAEGQDYESMRQVIAGMDVCSMGLAMAEISDALPTGPRGRIWAQLMPEIFVGNAPYVLYVVNDYFFLDAS